MSRKPSAYRFEFLHRPGEKLSAARQAHLIGELRDCAATCFSEIPDYQCLRGTREELCDKVIALAWRDDGKLAGFCSAVLLPIEGIGEVFHLGLTCVRPEDRSAGLTHKLTSRATIGYLVRYRPFSKMWVTNVACVLSSLGNVALHFEQVFPSPHYGERPSAQHEKIARTINERYRDKIYIADDARFDAESYVFRGSVKETVFQKAQNDARFHHRDAALNDYYGELMSWDAGDEVLQIGYCTALTGVKYGLGKVLSKPKPAAPRRAAPLGAEPGSATDAA